MSSSFSKNTSLSTSFLRIAAVASLTLWLSISTVYAKPGPSTEPGRSLVTAADMVALVETSIAACTTLDPDHIDKYTSLRVIMNNALSKKNYAEILGTPDYLREKAIAEDDWSKISNPTGRMAVCTMMQTLVAHPPKRLQVRE